MARYIASGEPVEVTKNGQPVGVFVPMSQPQRFDAEAFVAATDKVRATLRTAGVNPDDIVTEFDRVRRARA